MSKRKITALACGAAAALALAAGGVAHAATSFITSPIGYAGPGLDLSAFATGNYNFTFGPITVDHYTFTASPGDGVSWPFGGNSGQGSVVGQGSYGLASNGSFGGSAIYIGVDSGAGFADLVLNGGPVSEIGFFMNYAPNVGNPATIEALDINGNVFASYSIPALAPISTPGGFNAFEFRGIRSDAADIYGLRFGGNYILVTGTATGVGNDGSTFAEPLLPNFDPGNGGFGFEVTVNPNQRIVIDPLVATGYVYELTSTTSGPIFGILELEDLGDPDGYDIYDLDDNVIQLDFMPALGNLLDLTPFNLTGFKILDIDPNLGLDPTDELAFKTGLTIAGITGPTTVQITQTPVVIDFVPDAIPEPSTWGMMIGGFALAGGALRRRRTTVRLRLA